LSSKIAKAKLIAAVEGSGSLRYVEKSAGFPKTVTREATRPGELEQTVGFEVDRSDSNEEVSTRGCTISEEDLTFFNANIKGKITPYSASRSCINISRITPGIDSSQADFTEGST
jgi:hypothetical protein